MLLGLVVSHGFSDRFLQAWPALVQTAWTGSFRDQLKDN
jgi:hypothetical protein